MRLSYGQLRNAIKSVLVEAVENDDVVLHDGSVVPRGSEKHIDDIRTVIDGLESLKQQYRRGSAARARLADAASFLKRLVRKAENKPVGVPDREPRTFAQLETDVGEHGGLGRGSSGMGQTNPGNERRP